MQKNSWTLIVIIFCFSTLNVLGQQKGRQIPLTRLLDSLSTQYQIQFNYQSNLLHGIEVFPAIKNTSLAQQIKRIENEAQLFFSKVGTSIYTITKAVKICGYVYNASNSKPLQDATVSSVFQNVVTDKEGYFELTLPSLDVAIEIRYLGFRTLRKQALFYNEAICSNILMYEEEQEISSIVVEGYLVRGIDKKSDGTTRVDFSKFTSLPGLIETDVLQTVQSLPGIVSTDETVSNINIRGGSHDQNLILWDGIKMYQSGHFFGLISSFNPQITKTVSMITNGSEASLTDGVSGTIQMNTDNNLQEEFEGSFGVNFISADFFADLPLGEKSSVQIAGRRSLDDLIRTPTYQAYFDRITQETEIANNESNVINSNQHFGFYDTSFRWLYHPSEKEQIKANFILINNSLSFDESTSSNGGMETKESILSQNSVGVGLSYDREWNSNLTTHLSIYNSDYKLKANNANVLKQQRFLQENIVSETGINASTRYHWNLLVLESGYQFIETKVVNVNDIDVPRFLRRDEEVLREHAFYLQSAYRSKDRTFSLKPGVRMAYIGEYKTLFIEPRISVRKKLGNSFQIEALGEFKHQNTSQIINFQNDFLGIEKRRWQLTDNNLNPILKSRQASLGLQYSKKGWLVDATVYYKEVDGITSQSQGFTTKYEFTKTQGSYAVNGLDFLVRKQSENISSWFSYSYMLNNYTFSSLEEIQFPSNFDNTHSVTIGSTYSTKFLNLSGGLNYRTGKPTSIPLSRNEIINGEINFDAANNTRLIDFFRVDFSATYKLRISKGLGTELGMSVWNLLDKKNAINNYYRIDTDNIPVQFSRASLGLTTNFMIRCYF